MMSPLHRALMCIAALSLAAVAAGFPRPNPYPISWELNFEHAMPRRVVVKPPGAQAPEAYWYMTFTVTNKTQDEQRFLPVFELMTEDGKTIRSDKDIDPSVLLAIRLREKNKALQSVNEIAGTLQVGEDQAKEGVAIWREPNPEMGKFTIYVTGLCGESVMLKDDAGKPVTRKLADGTEEPVVLWKTLEIRYHMPGDDALPGIDVIDPMTEKWIMR